jgi:hypothetical protein
VFKFKLNKFVLRNKDTNGEGSTGGGTGSGGDTGTNGDTLTLEQLMQENAAMRKKMDELLNETKRAKQLRREAEEQAAIEAAEKARKAGDFEQLYKSSEEQRKQFQTELEKLKTGIAKEKVKGASRKLAADLADGHNIELLSEFIERRLRFDSDDIKVLNNNGELTVSTLENLRDEIKADARYKSLIRGSQASGGGATGNRGDKGTTKTMTRAEFDALDHGARSAFFASGGKIN